MKRVLVSAALAAGLIGCAVSAPTSAPAPALDPKAEAQAREVVGPFLTAVKNNEPDAARKMTDLPWYAAATDNVIKDGEALAAHLNKRLSHIDPEKVSSRVVEVVPYSAFRDTVKNEGIRKNLDEVLSKDDLVVRMAPESEVPYVFVRIRDGKAKVIGFGRLMS